MYPFSFQNASETYLMAIIHIGFKIYFLECIQRGHPWETIFRALQRGGSVSSVKVKYFTVSGVDLKITTSSVDLA